MLPSRHPTEALWGTGGGRSGRRPGRGTMSRVAGYFGRDANAVDGNTGALFRQTQGQDAWRGQEGNNKQTQGSCRPNCEATC